MRAHVFCFCMTHKDFYLPPAAPARARAAVAATVAGAVVVAVAAAAVAAVAPAAAGAPGMSSSIWGGGIDPDI